MSVDAFTELKDFGDLERHRGFIEDTRRELIRLGVLAEEEGDERSFVRIQAEMDRLVEASFKAVREGKISFNVNQGQLEYLAGDLPGAALSSNSVDHLPGKLARAYADQALLEASTLWKTPMEGVTDGRQNRTMVDIIDGKIVITQLTGKPNTEDFITEKALDTDLDNAGDILDGGDYAWEPVVPDNPQDREWEGGGDQSQVANALYRDTRVLCRDGVPVRTGDGNAIQLTVSHRNPVKMNDGKPFDINDDLSWISGEVKLLKDQKQEETE